MPEKPETVPPPSYIEAVRSQVLEEVLAKVSAEASSPIKAKVYVFKDGERVRELGVLEVEGQGEEVREGEIRVRFRPTFFPDRYLFLADSILDGNPEISGFAVRGDVKAAGEEGEQANYRSWVLKRNDANWMKWL